MGKNIKLIWVKKCQNNMGKKCQNIICQKCQINMGKKCQINMGKNIKSIWVKILNHYESKYVKLIWVKNASSAIENSFLRVVEILVVILIYG